MPGQMKPGPFGKLIDEAVDLGIDVSDATPDAESVAELRRCIDERKTEQATMLAEEAAHVDEEEDAGEHPVLIRVIEWAEWLPASMHVLGEKEDPQRRGELMTQTMPLHNGFTGFMARDDERVLEVALQGTGQRKVIEVDETDEKGETLKLMYGHYLFQATLARNVSKEYFDGVMDGQQKPLVEGEKRMKEKGHDRKKDLLVVKSGVIPPDTTKPPNRNQRRGGKARRSR